MDVPSVSIAQLPENVTLLDVREQDEWDAGHASGAQHLPSSQLMERYGEVPDETVYVVCRGGGRSAKVTAWLNQNGFEAINVLGGMGAWADANLPLVAADVDAEPFIK